MFVMQFTSILVNYAIQSQCVHNDSLKWPFERPHCCSIFGCPPGMYVYDRFSSKSNTNLFSLNYI